MRRMKDSGIAWIGEIPQYWDVEPIKYLYNYSNGNAVCVGPFGSSLPSSEIRDSGVWVYNQRAVLDNNFDTNNIFINEKKAKELSAFAVSPGDILITTRGSIGKIAIVPEDAHNGILHPCVIRFRINNKYSTKLLKYIFNESDIAIQQINYMNNSTTIGVLYSYSLKEIKLPTPPLPEQHRIADYLDAKCAEINRSMELVRQSMDKLKAYRMAVITEAVTKGLDPDVPMKDSGVPWIGKIPEGWEVSSVRWEFDNLDGRRKPISSENRVITHGSYDYYGASGVIDKIDEYIFDEPLLLIGEDGANLALRNLPLIYIATGKYWVNNHAHILKPKMQNDFFYMAYQLECVDLFHFLTGSTQPKLTQANLSKIPVVCPPLTEQVLIVAYLDAKCAEIDAIIAKKQELLDKLTAYKKSLIFECVTGKREVAA